MKNILRGAVASIALIGMIAPAAAQTNQRHYAATVPVLGNVTLTNPTGIGGAVAALAFEGAILAGIGTRYTAQADAPSDSETATPTVTTTFQLTGSVNKDCSFYAGNNANATNIDFGVIGVRTGNNENVNSAFEMVGAANADVETLTAGCNFNNEIKIVKSSALGLINQTASGFASDQFQANIPYSVTAAWTGVETNQVQAGTGKTLAVSTSQTDNTRTQGAWRSRMTINFNAPAITNKGLTAGNYTGSTTLTLKAL